MEYRKLPGTSLRVSRVCLGTMMFGEQTDEAESLAIMDYAFEQGVNFFDTANVYVQGESERIVGKALKGKREKIILATKVFGQMGDDPNDAGLSRRNILSAVDKSLKRLDTDYIDIYYLHAPDYGTAIQETLDAMTCLVRSGKVRYVGVSNYAAWQIADILAACDRCGFVPPVITQNVYNPITRGIEAELVPFLKEHPMAMAIYNPIAGGLLAGKHRPGTPEANTRFANNPVCFARYWSEENFDAVGALEGIAAEADKSILQLALKWCAAQSHVTSIITGVSKLAQIKMNLAALDGEPLSQETLEKCNMVWKALAGTRFAYNR